MFVPDGAQLAVAALVRNLYSVLPVLRTVPHFPEAVMAKSRFIGLFWCGRAKPGLVVLRHWGKSSTRDYGPAGGLHC
jgi:hypothetical protein